MELVERSSCGRTSEAGRETSDGFGGAIITWEDERSGAEAADVYAQLVDASGAVRWAANGVPITTAANEQRRPRLIPDGVGGAIVTWMDERNYPPATDIYAQRVDRYGYLGFASAAITEVVDHPNDQGGVAVVSWTPSYLDAYPNQMVTHYSVWMRIPDESLARALGVGWTPLLAGEMGGSTDLGVLMARSGWTHVEDVPAYYLSEYGCHAPTYGDSTESGIPWTEYMVIANTGDHWVFWESEAASGYSVDNVAPGAPSSLAALPAQTDVELYWSPSGYFDDDLAHYNIYRSETSGFVPDEATFVDATVDTFYIDTEPGRSTWYYVVAAEDIHGNVGPPSNEVTVEVWTSVEEPVAPMSFALRGSRPNPFSGLTSVAFDVPAGGGEVRIEVYDVSGRRVRVLVDGHESAGRRMVAWDGSDEGGRRVASGVYYCRMKAGTYEETTKLTLIR